MSKQISLKEIYDRIKADYDIESLLRPYREGGTPEAPILRSSGVILNWLINKKKFSPDIAGAGLISVLMDIKQGKSFQGDGSFGSKGDQLDQAIAQRCNDFANQKLRVEMFQTIAGAKLEVMEEAIFEMVRAQLPWFIKLVASGSWRWLRARKLKKRKTVNNEPA